MKNAFNSAAWLCAFFFAALQWLGLVLVRLVLLVLGLPVVALAVFWPVAGYR